MTGNIVDFEEQLLWTEAQYRIYTILFHLIQILQCFSTNACHFTV